ncbi:Crp/Fnr family transcriptional regulator [Treponema pedis]|uniref:Crp/Fnr family transcriptional regulator n=1 Tax=Treponema pedis TaxID=409322 RepID=UPI003141CCAE
MNILKQQKIDVLNLDRFKIFNNISEKSRKRLKALNLKKIKFAANEIVKRQGDRLTAALLIDSGCLRVIEYTIDGQEKVSSYYSAHDAFPFYLHFGKTANFPYDVYAMKNSEVFFLPFDEVRKIIDEDIIFMRNIMEFIAEYTCFYRLLLRATQYPKVVQRIAYWILHTDEIDSLKYPSSQKMLANILRVNRPSLNQELKKLNQKGIIKTNGMHFKILNREFLEDLV